MIGLVFYSMICYKYACLALTLTKTYIISGSRIIAKNLINGKVQTYDSTEVRGFSKSSIRYKFRRKPYKQILIYLTNGEVLELLQLLYADIDKIEQSLLIHHYFYLGYEDFKSKGLFRRAYQFL